MTKQIIRIHASNNVRCGVYRTGSIGVSEYHDAHRHPGPWSDSGLNYSRYTGRNWFFGFGGISQLRSWFYKDDFFIDFHDKIEVSLVECVDAHVGNAQAVFNIDSVTAVYTYQSIAVLDWDDRDKYLKRIEAFKEN